jgi:hypothetical protein
LILEIIGRSVLAQSVSRILPSGASNISHSVFMLPNHDFAVIFLEQATEKA